MRSFDRRLRLLLAPFYWLCIAVISCGACAQTASGSEFSDDVFVADDVVTEGDVLAVDGDDARDIEDADDIEDVEDARDVADGTLDRVVPEDCSTPFDDNGDGRANENCPCTTGETQMCFERSMSAFLAMCRMGQQRCGADGTWGTCIGSWLPDALGRCTLTERFSDTMTTRRPVDVVWFLDTSGSMTAETMAVNVNLNRFASLMAETGVDYQVIMIARRGTAARYVCAPPPLGGPACSDGPRFRHINQPVGSTDGLRRVLDTWSLWRGALRAGASRFIVAVTDDDSALGAEAFDRSLRALGGWDGYTFNSIVGYETREDCPTMVRRGSVYLALTERTRGQRARVCASDWSGIFSELARGIASRVTSWALSQRPRVDTIRVFLTEPGRPERALTTGWTYDAATNRITLSPEAIPMVGSVVRVTYRTVELSP